MEDNLNYLLSTTDAKKWAKAFIDLLATGPVLDEELMLVWFAGAIETGREAGRRGEGF